MNIGNITSDNFNLDGNGKDIQIEVYEQLIEQLQQENKQQKEVIDKAIEYIEKLNRIIPRFWFTKLLELLKEVSE